MGFWERIKRLFGIGEFKADVMVVDRPLTVGERIWNVIASAFSGSKYQSPEEIEEVQNAQDLDLPPIEDGPKKKTERKPEAQTEKAAEAEVQKAAETKEQKKERRRVENIRLIQSRMSPRDMGLNFTPEENEKLMADPNAFTDKWEMPEEIARAHGRMGEHWKDYRDFACEITKEISDDTRIRMGVRKLTTKEHLLNTADTYSYLRLAFEGYQDPDICPPYERNDMLRDALHQHIIEGRPQALEEMSFGRTLTPEQPAAQVTKPEPEAVIPSKDRTLE